MAYKIKKRMKDYKKVLRLTLIRFSYEQGLRQLLKEQNPSFEKAHKYLDKIEKTQTKLRKFGY